ADDRAPGANRQRVRGADRGCAGTPSGRGRTPDDDSGRQRDGSIRNRRGDRGRHEPLCDRRTLALVGRALSATKGERAGKIMSRRLRYGAPWLKTVLVQWAWAASRHKDGYLRAQFLRIKSRRGPKKAIMAVAASMLTAAYYLVRDPVPYRELGPHYLLRLDHERAATRLT